jgi:hypothetical protein
VTRYAAGGRWGLERRAHTGGELREQLARHFFDHPPTELHEPAAKVDVRLDTHLGRVAISPERTRHAQSRGIPSCRISASPDDSHEMAGVVDLDEFRAPLEARRYRSNANLDRPAKHAITLERSQLRTREA